MNKFRLGLAMGTSIIALNGTAALAQETPDSNSSVSQAGDHDIVVTARKRVEVLQDVPVAITALSSEDLASNNVVTAEDVQRVAPGVSISGSAGPSGTLISVRGISNRETTGFAQTTAIYLDGVYMPRPESAFFSLDDVERIEVLRGPQGTLYGRNSTAGLINILTRAPGNELSGGVDVSYGNHEEIRARGHVSGPLAGGLSAGISGAYQKRDGFYRNPVTGNDLGDLESYTARGTLRYVSPDGNLDVRLSGDIVRKDEQTVTYRVDLLDPDNPQTIVPNPIFPSPLDTHSQADEDRINVHTEQEGGALSINYSVSDNFDLVSLTSLRSYSVNNVYRVTLCCNTANETFDQFSQEVRGLLTTDAFDLTIGGNYYKEDQDFEIVTRTGSRIADKSRVEALAGFVSGTWRANEQLSFDAGLRLNHETRDVNSVLSVFTSPVVHLKDTAWIPSFGVNYKITPDILLYGKVSKGYQAGGYNVVGNVIVVGGAPALETDTFGPEQLWAYEVGLKTQFLDGRVTINLAAFHSDYKDIQVTTAVSVDPIVLRTDNAGAAKVDGFEVEMAVEPTDGLTLSIGSSYVHARYTDFCDGTSDTNPANGDVQGNCPAAGLVQRAGRELPNAPRWTLTLGADYQADLGFGVLRANVSYNHRDSSNFQSNDVRQGETGAIDNLSARLGVSIGQEGPEIYAYGTNLTNNYYREYASYLGASGTYGRASAPRQYGVGMRYKF
jgi:iron complex outermembrane recepter protein